jgi:UDPglucose 6-dehydrogenase
MRLGMIGVGKLGLPCAEVMAERHHVEGFDVVPVRPVGFAMVDTLSQVCADKEIIFVAVPTPHDAAYAGDAPSVHLPPRNFDYGIVTRLLSELNRYTTPDQLVALISTVLPGTTRREFAPLALGYRLVYNPYLIAGGSVQWDMLNPEMIIIGTADGSATEAARLIRLYESLVQNAPRFVIGTWDEAESIKIFYNTFISAKVSLVNMIQDVAERVGNIDVDVVTDALKHSSRRIMGPAYMTAGMGDGGACHPRDNIALRWLAKELDLRYDLFEAIMASREVQAANLARRLVGLAEQYSLDEIWIHGKTYKPHVNCTDGSYSLLVAHYVQAMKRPVRFVDPLTGDSVSKISGVVLLAHDATVAFGNTSSSTAQQFYCAFEAGSVIVDPWRRVDPSLVKGCIVVHYGNTRSRPTSDSLIIQNADAAHVVSRFA